MKKLIRNTKSPEGRAFWDSVKKSADTLRDAPEWMRAGVTLDATHFVTFEPKEAEGTIPASGREKRSV